MIFFWDVLIYISAKMFIKKIIYLLHGDYALSLFYRANFKYSHHWNDVETA